MSGHGTSWSKDHDKDICWEGVCERIQFFVWRNREQRTDDVLGRGGGSDNEGKSVRGVKAMNL